MPSKVVLSYYHGQGHYVLDSKIIEYACQASEGMIRSCKVIRMNLVDGHGNVRCLENGKDATSLGGLYS